MKTSILILLVLLCVGCEESLLPTEKSLTIESSTTFQISNSLKLYPAVEYIDGSLWEVVVYYFIGSEIVNTDTINPVLTNEISAKLAISSNCEKIKFSFQLAPKKSQYYCGASNCRRYSANFIVLEKGKNNVIEIKDLSSIKLSL
jgi:hypothetical protein